MGDIWLPVRLASLRGVSEHTVERIISHEVILLMQFCLTGGAWHPHYKTHPRVHTCEWQRCIKAEATGWMELWRAETGIASSFSQFPNLEPWWVMWWINKIQYSSGISGASLNCSHSDPIWTKYELSNCTNSKRCRPLPGTQGSGTPVACEEFRCGAPAPVACCMLMTEQLPSTCTYLKSSVLAPPDGESGTKTEQAAAWRMAGVLVYSFHNEWSD